MAETAQNGSGSPLEVMASPDHDLTRQDQADIETAVKRGWISAVDDDVRRRLIKKLTDIAANTDKDRVLNRALRTLAALERLDIEREKIDAMRDVGKMQAEAMTTEKMPQPVFIVERKEDGDDQSGHDKTGA